MRFALPLFLLLCAGCAHQGWQPARGRVCAGTLCYRVGELGPGWRVVHEEGAEVGFFDAASGAVIQSNATCRDDADATPLSTLTGHLLLGYTERSIRSEALVRIDRREGLRTVVAARLDGVPVVLELLVFKRDGCIFDLSFAATPSQYPVARPAFERFVEGFADLGRS